MTQRRIVGGAAIAGLAFAAFIADAHAVTVTNTTDAAELANAIAGSGITISNPTLTFDTAAPAGKFTGGASSVGFADGIVLTTGTTACVAGPNNQGGCTGTGASTSLKFDFTSDTGEVFFRYVFGSEEYTHYAPSGFNDRFELRLDGVNIAQLPGGAGIVSINNVNCFTNSSFYRNNTPAGFGENNNPAECGFEDLDIQYDGLTTILTASATLDPGIHTFEFFITDVGDSSLDSGVFIQAGSFSGTDPGTDPVAVPEPSSLALAALGLLGLGVVRRRRT